MQDTSTAIELPYPVIVITCIWIVLVAAYFIIKCQRKAKDLYIAPRVFVLCSPRNVQYHYELVLRVGLPSVDFNPERHDIDITVQGQQKNEVVPMTRLNTRTLFDEPLITNLSLVVYRLVEIPPLGALLLSHSGPFKSWLYVYDFTVIDLLSNREQYYTINQYIGSLSRLVQLMEPNIDQPVDFPIDDVPLPEWSLGDKFLIIFATSNWIMLTITLMPINCYFLLDTISIAVAALAGASLLLFLEWLVYYNWKWNQERREFFNDVDGCSFCQNEFVCRIVLSLIACLIGATCVYFAFFITDWRDSIVWLLTTINSGQIVIGCWNACRTLNLGETLVGIGLKLKGTEIISVGMPYSDMVSDVRTKSGSASDDGSMIEARKSSRQRSFGPRSSVKSFGFNLLGRIHSSVKHKTAISAISSAGLSSHISRNHSLMTPTAPVVQFDEGTAKRIGASTSSKSGSARTVKMVALDAHPRSSSGSNKRQNVTEKTVRKEPTDKSKNSSNSKKLARRDNPAQS